jgi:hypothetical protein
MVGTLTSSAVAQLLKQTRRKHGMRRPTVKAGVCGKQNGAFEMPCGDEPEEVLCVVVVKGAVAEFVEVEDVAFFVPSESFGVGAVDEGGV